jgi:hypothetical protein
MKTRPAGLELHTGKPFLRISDAGRGFGSPSASQAPLMGFVANYKPPQGSVARGDCGVSREKEG